MMVMMIVMMMMMVMTMIVMMIVMMVMMIVMIYDDAVKVHGGGGENQSIGDRSRFHFLRLSCCSSFR